jgi:tetratricopeptide (TPR) repeat protein
VKRIGILKGLFIIPVVFFLGWVLLNFPGNASAAEKEEKEDYYSLYQKGKDLFYQKDYYKAKKKFESVLDIQNNHRGANQYLGRIYLLEKNYSKAIKHLEDCLAETTGSYKQKPLYYLAKAYEGAGRRLKALGVWKEYLRYVEAGSRWENEAEEHIRNLEKGR